MLLGQNENRNNSQEIMAAVINMNAVDLTELVPKTSSEGLFNYVDDMLKYIGPVADEYHGRLIGISHGGIAAVFPQSCEDALMSSISICQRIIANTNENFDFSDFAVGLSYGVVYTDQVGYGSYRVPLTISECTRIACKLQEIAVKYSAHILISETAVRQIPEFFSKFNSRCLGSILDDIGDHQLIYDVFDGDQIKTKNSKRRSKLFFETGIKLFQEKKYETARSYFIELIKTDRNDKAAKEYLYACDRIMNGVSV